MSTGVPSCNSPNDFEVCLSPKISTVFVELFGVLLGDPNEALSGGYFTLAAGSEVKLQDDWKMKVCKANSNNLPARNNQKLAAGSSE